MRLDKEQIKLCAKYVWQNYGTEIIIGGIAGTIVGLNICTAISVSRMEGYFRDIANAVYKEN